MSTGPVWKGLGVLVVALLGALLAPATARPDAPPGATALCNDRTYSFSATRSGTCSHHGGVAVWLTGTGSPAPPPPPTTLPVVPISGSVNGFVSPLNAAEYDAYSSCFPSYGSTLARGRIDWGDGASTDVGESASGVVHVYARSGSFTITLTCTDTAGFTATNAATAVVTAPVKTGASGSVLLAARTKTSGCRAGILPDRACSPGAYDARVTQDTIQATICVAGYTATVRNVPTSEKTAVYREYGIVHHAPYSYEIDHIVSLELGGSNDIANLYPEAYAGTNGARVKDKLENRLHAAVCRGQITLTDAQKAIASNWLVASTQYGSR